VATNNLSTRNLFDIALGVAASTAAATTASAQAPNWTGFYVGAHGSYRIGDINARGGDYLFSGGNDIYTLPGFNNTSHPNNFMGGPHVGFNWQVSPTFLVGIESDLDYGKESRTIARNIIGTADDGDGFTFNSSATYQLGWQGTIRGRMGYVANNWLFYSTAGIAFTKVKYNSAWSLVHSAGDFTGANSAALEKTLTGFVFGGGVETMLTPNILLRVEYLYETFENFTAPFGIGQTAAIDIDNIQKVRVGISFKIP
jgi:outer membrane immunogenic protein